MKAISRRKGWNHDELIQFTCSYEHRSGPYCTPHSVMSPLWVKNVFAQSLIGLEPLHEKYFSAAQYCELQHVPAMKKRFNNSSEQ